jgi:hypothetical protein
MTPSRRGHGNLLQIIEDEEEFAIAEDMMQSLPRRLVLRLPNAEHLGDGRYDQVRLVDRRQRDEGDAVGERCGKIRRHAQRETRLAGSTGSGEGDELDVVAPQQGDNLGDDTLTPDEGGRRRR